jgi:hypothetical protein
MSAPSLRERVEALQTCVFYGGMSRYLDAVEVSGIAADGDATIAALRVQVKQADERGDEAMRRAHAAESQVSELRDLIRSLSGGGYALECFDAARSAGTGEAGA